VSREGADVVEHRDRDPWLRVGPRAAVATALGGGCSGGAVMWTQWRQYRIGALRLFSSARRASIGGVPAHALVERVAARPFSQRDDGASRSAVSLSGSGRREVLPDNLQDARVCENGGTRGGHAHPRAVLEHRVEYG
jgi:hypothetical protein